MNDLLTYDHSELGELLDRIFAAFKTSDGERIYHAIDIFWAHLALHIRAEHLHLFPAILAAFESPERSKENASEAFENARNEIANMRGDHDFFMRELANTIKEMRDLREKNQPDSAHRLLIVRETVAAVSRRLETHNEREETDIYRWAERLFNQSKLADLNARMQKELDNLPLRFWRIE